MTSLRPMSWLRGVALVVAGMAGALHAVEVASPFSDHAVLQRDLPVPVWGTEHPGTTVTVRCAGQAVTAVAGADGRWKVVLAPLTVGGPFELIVSGSTTVTIRDVLVGEVWLCSGQSNMLLSVDKAHQAAEEIAQADHPRIRLLNRSKGRMASEKPVDSFPARWAVCSPTTVGDFSAVGYYFGRELEKELQVPIGLVSSAWGGTMIEAWTSTEALAASPEFAATLTAWEKVLADYPANLEKYQRVTLPAWEKAAAAAKAAGKPEPKKPEAPRGPTTPQHRPGGLFNGMIAPLIPYAFRGVVWYQGESNSHWANRVESYRRLLPLLIGDWRSRFDRELIFHIVQLPNFGPATTTTEPWPVINWPIMRESQAVVAATVPKSDLTVTIDLGNPDDVHPTNKQEVGRRVALNALAHDYGRNVVTSGPIFHGMTVEGTTAVVTFDQAEGLAVRGDTLTGFQLAGADGRFQPATGTVDGATVRLQASGIATPVAVRYAWDNSPAVSLVNAAGLPARPFRFPER